MSQRNPPSSPAVPALAPLLLLVAAAGEAMLAVYQWMELLAVRGGATPMCALNETVNCATVWNSVFASRVHAWLGVPVAGLGVWWGLLALAVSLMLVHRVMKGAPVRTAVAAVRLVALGGVLGCVTFAAASAQAGAVCLTCLATYALVAAYAAVAVKMLPGPWMPERADAQHALGWVVGLGLLLFAGLLYPGRQTPSGEASALPSLAQGGDGPTPARVSAPPDAGSGRAPGPLEPRVIAFLNSLPWAEQQAVSDSLAVYRAATPVDGSAFPTRFRFGPSMAPVRIVEWTDIRCGHCRHFAEALAELKQSIPMGLFSVEPRHFPLDGECNRFVQRSTGNGVSCTAAKAQICLEGASDFWELQHKLFEAQAELTREKVLELASSGSMPRAALEACIARPQTQEKLDQDLAYAMAHQLKGTPLVVVNGREATPVAPFLYALALLGGDASSPAFDKLPPPRL